MFSAKSGWGLGPALPGGAMSVTCEGLVYSPRIKYLLELANYQHVFTGCPVLLCPWPLCSGLASTSCVEALGHSQQTHAPCPLRDIPSWDGVLCGNLLSTNDSFMTETPRGHSPRVLFTVVVHLQIFPPGSWSGSSAELPLS